ncbi:MAG: endopeptidase La [Thermoleophilia bacterium]|nr:endopeptidase La [Thermoleophilia bacterium]
MAESQRTLPLLATRDLILFPKMLTPIFVGREKSVRALELAHQTGGPLILSVQKQATLEDPNESDIERVGTLAKVVQLSRLADGTVKALVEGQSRVSIESFASVSPLFSVSYRPLRKREPKNILRVRALMDSVAREFSLYVSQSPQLPEEAETALDAVIDPEDVVDTVAALLAISPDRKQDLLEGEDVEERLMMLLEILIQENEFLAIEQDIAERVHDNLERHQRKVFLRERLRVLRDELGEEEDDESEQGQYLKMIQERGLPETTSAALTKEARRLSDLPPFSAEVAVVKTYLDHALGLPWGTLSGEGLPDVQAVARVLDETHYGLADVKDRIVEYLAVARLRKGTPPNTTLCLVGPPGVGKTSVAMAIAEGLNRPLQRISLGGVRDEAEIRGHRKTYVGAMPGRILDALKRAGVDDPVILLDELDKMESDWRGDPAAALMEVLDPVQNQAFRDTYLELDYDLSRVLFVATANYEEDIPETLHDRLEVIRLPGYTEREKEEIARRHLVPKLAEQNGLAELGDIFTRVALRTLIRFYTREAGVRELARLAGKVYRKLARMRVEGKPLPRRVAPRDLERLLGAPPFLKARLEDTPQIGVSTGLAYTGAGGDILRIETVVAPGKGDFHITGQLGEVMQESVTAAWGYLKTALSRDTALAALWSASPGKAYLLDQYSPPDGGPGEGPAQLGIRLEEAAQGEVGTYIDQETDIAGGVSACDGGGPADHELLSALEIRMHLPEGAVPKEGPSAGVAVAASLLSALTQLPLEPRVALSGEITLTGQVLAVGGLKEKLLAALREGVDKVVLPADVRPQVRELPVELTRGLEIVYVSSFAEVLEHVLVVGPGGARPPAGRHRAA